MDQKSEACKRWIQTLHRRSAVHKSARLCGVKPIAIPAARQRVLISEINSLFDAFRFRTNLCEREAFEAAHPFNKLEAHKALRSFVQDVTTCPQVVLDKVRQLLAEKHRLELTQVESERS